jgi:tetratricopeptide (TPR) repeat protein
MKIWPCQRPLDGSGCDTSNQHTGVVSDSASLPQQSIQLREQPDGWTITIASAIETGNVEFFVPKDRNQPAKIVCDSRAESRPKPFDVLFAEGHFAAAQAAAERELTIARQKVAGLNVSTGMPMKQIATCGECRDLVKSLGDVAAASYRNGDYEVAEAALVEAIEICERAPEHYGPTLIRLIHDWANTRSHSRCTDEESTVEIQRELSRTIQRSEQLLGPEHLETARLMTTYARLLISDYAYIEAEELLTDAIRIRASQLGARHREVTESLLELARLNAYRECNSEADDGFRQVLAIREAECGPRHPDVAEVLFHYADFFMYNRKDSAGAGPLLRRALDIWNETNGLDHPMVARESSFIRKVLSMDEPANTETIA